jgi:U3 small nucleolar RNA-associated protein 23
MGRLKRQKQHRKTLDFYRMQFHIHRPFKVLLDGNFLHACIKNNINIHDRLSTTLSDPQVQLLVPDEVIAELTGIGAPCADALALASTFKRAPTYTKSRDRQKQTGTTNTTGTTDTTGSPTPETTETTETSDATTTAAKGILTLLGQHNRHQYLVATQDVNLRKSTHRIPGVPVIYLNIGVSVVEPPSRASKEYQQTTEQKKLAPRKDERRRLQQKQQHERAAARAVVKTGRDAELNLPRREDVAAFPMKSKKRKGPRGPKQPNPLSMRKKKKRNNEDGKEGKTRGGGGKDAKKKRRQRQKAKKKVKTASDVGAGAKE